VDMDCRQETGHKALMSLVQSCVLLAWTSALCVCVSMLCLLFSQQTCASLSQDEDVTSEKNEVLDKIDPTHYSKLDPKSLKVFDQYFLPLLFKIHRRLYIV